MPIWRPATTASPRARRGRPSTKNPNQVPPLAAQVEILHAVGKDKEAPRGLSHARAARPLGRPRPAGLPPPRADRRPLEGRQDLDEPQPAEPANSSGTDETAINRIDLTTLGPLVWAPFSAEPFSAARHHRRALEPGRPSRARTSSSSSSWAASVPTACSSSSSSARNTRPSRS